MTEKIPVSVVIPTKNEERNLKKCLESIGWSDDIILFDSYSDDKTLDIAEQNGVKIIQRHFDNFAAHKNWALNNIAFRHSWVLFLDADERITPELAQELSDLFKETPKYNGYYIARKNYFCGKWIKHGGWYPDWNMRLLHVGDTQYEQRLVHEHIIVNGEEGYLKNPLEHHDFKGMERYFDRHNTYSSLEAVECYNFLYGSKKQASIKGNLFSRGPAKRRFLKQLAYRYLSCRPLFKFFWMYFLKLGFLDWRMGFRYCLLHAFYEYQVGLKLEELRQADSPAREKYQDELQ